MPKSLVHCCDNNLALNFYASIIDPQALVRRTQSVYAKHIKTPTDGIVLIVSLRLRCIILTNNQDEAHIHNADSRPCFHILSRTHSPALDSISLLDQLRVN